MAKRVSYLLAWFIALSPVNIVVAQTFTGEAGEVLMLPESLSWTDGSLSKQDKWQDFEPWVDSLDQWSEVEVNTPDDVFQLLKEASEPGSENDAWRSFMARQGVWGAEVTLPERFATPDPSWVAIEQGLGLNPVGSARLRLAMAQVVGPEMQLPGSTPELNSFFLGLEPEMREFFNRAICPHCLIIDGPSFVPVVFPKVPNGEPAVPVLMVKNVDTSSGASVDLPTIELPAEWYESSMIAATMFIVGKKTAESRVLGADGSISFPSQQTFHEALFGDNHLCPLGLQGYDAMREYREIKVLNGCGSVVVKDATDRPWLMTAKHCVKRHAYAKEILLLSDWVVIGSMQEMTMQMPMSREFELVSPFPNKYLHPSADLALLEMPQDMVRIAVPLPPRDSVRVSVGQSVTALTFPLGLPLNLVRGKDTVVSGVEKDRFWARIDNFANSSGGPVFTNQGELQGILVQQSNPGDQPLDVWHDGNCFVPLVENSDESRRAQLGATVVDARLAYDILDAIDRQ